MRNGSSEGRPPRPMSNWSTIGGGLEVSADPPPPPNGVEEDPNMSNMGFVGFIGLLLGFSSAPPLPKLSKALLVQLPLGSSWNLVCHEKGQTLAQENLNHQKQLLEDLITKIPIGKFPQSMISIQYSLI